MAARETAYKRAFARNPDEAALAEVVVETWNWEAWEEEEVDEEDEEDEEEDAALEAESETEEEEAFRTIIVVPEPEFESNR